MELKHCFFLSYRRNDGYTKYIENFYDIVRTEAQVVTNIEHGFFDTNKKNTGKTLPKVLYQAIESSCFFILIYNHNYLHKDNTYCAQELYYAIKIEKKIQEIAGSDFCFILPFLQRSEDGLPCCLKDKIFKNIRTFRHDIETHKDQIPTKAFIDFKEEINDILIDNYKWIEEKMDLIKELLHDIQPPSYEEIISWIEKQKEKQKAQESNNPPIYTK
jgi:hypothetical protein